MKVRGGGQQVRDRKRISRRRVWCIITQRKNVRERLSQRVWHVLIVKPSTERGEYRERQALWSYRYRAILSRRLALVLHANVIFFKQFNNNIIINFI